MGYNTSINGYFDIRAALDKALASSKGIRLRFPNKNAAMTFRGRVHQLRYLDRKENKRIYPEGDPMHGRSVYDPLMVRTESESVVLVLRLEGIEYAVEELE